VAQGQSGARIPLQCCTQSNYKRFAPVCVVNSFVQFLV